MSNVLVLNTSPSTSASVSRDLVGRIVDGFDALDRYKINQRDIGAAPPPHLDEATIGAFFTPPDVASDDQKAAMALSDELIDEFLDSDIIVVGLPMHNLGITSSLKTYVDHIVRVGKTFVYTEQGAQGLVPAGKKMIVVTSRGGIYSEGPMQPYDMQVNYVRAIFGFIGVTDIEFIHCEGVTISDDLPGGQFCSGRVSADRACVVAFQSRGRVR